MRIIYFLAKRVGHRLSHCFLTKVSPLIKTRSMATETDLTKKYVVRVPKRVRENPAIRKIDSDEFRGIFTKELEELIALFKKYNYELRIAGGAVRDLLINIPPKDIDLATTATPLEMKEMFTHEQVRIINTKGERHGTITARILDKENFEVTTLRVDVVMDGRHAEVKFTTDWQLDANRRDLTINSMFLDFDGTVYDYFYGYEDLMNRRVVFVGNASARIVEDYLRILRYFRFYGRIAQDAYSHDKPTLKAIRENVVGLDRISGERVWSELQKIVVGNFGYELMLEMINCGLGPYCGLPKEPNMTEFQRLCTTILQFPKPHTSVLYMIALLRNRDDVIRLHERLKLSANERDLAFYIVQQRDNANRELTTLQDFQKLCLQPYARRKFVEELLTYVGKLDVYSALKAWTMPKFPVNGNMLKDRCKIHSKNIGTVISALKLIWADSNFALSADDLLNKHLLDVLGKLSSSSSPSVKKRLL